MVLVVVVVNHGGDGGGGGGRGGGCGPEDESKGLKDDIDCEQPGEGASASSDIIEEMPHSLTVKNVLLWGPHCATASQHTIAHATPLRTAERE